ncbi:MAG: hypothetical protein HOI23_03030 [Deltaproteobacteria bacterium]|jgi:hypothetical protein|nr:hypothetical protein [Deltaproteobacteria bacterium]MBT6432185.1 hypothetical protein [Deltaproteobacteria bacterium]MBT6488690.1 hypothetical protein [Deltaproteobacteria bacterium]
MSGSLPPCGIYKTTINIGSVPADRFVYFHNHGDPGAGIYLPARWLNNRAEFSKQGVPLTVDHEATTLIPLPPEGLYRVRQTFKCSANSNMTFQPGQLVQLGYNRRADSILFIPIWDESGLMMPDRGVLMEPENIRYLEQLLVGHAKSDPTQIFH